MHLTHPGNHHFNASCNLCEDDNYRVDCTVGSEWVETMQRYIISDKIRLAGVADKSCRSWYINHFADPPFYHMKVQSQRVKDPELSIKTVLEAVYEKPDSVFDGGLFSNTAVELRAKLNSNQTMWKALGVSASFKTKCNPCSKMSNLAIQYTLDHAPSVVKRRYAEKGIQLKTGRNIQKTDGPSWIWARLNFLSDCQGTRKTNHATLLIHLPSPLIWTTWFHLRVKSYIASFCCRPKCLSGCTLTP